MKVYFLITALIVFMLAMPVSAQKGKDDDSGPRHKISAELNLTDSQKEQIEKLRSSHQLKAIDLKAEIAKLRIQIKDEMNNKTIDESKVLSLTKKVSDLQAQLKESAVSMHIKSYNLLDEKQKEIWKENRPGFEGKFLMGEGSMKHMRENIKHKRMEHDCPFKDEN
jgi:Spy/CpxP family protein refolding chaperone